METFSVLLALCAGNSLVSGEDFGNLADSWQLLDKTRSWWQLSGFWKVLCGCYTDVIWRSWRLKSLMTRSFLQQIVCHATWLTWQQSRVECMMTTSNGNIFRVTSLLWGEFTGEFPSQRPVTRSFYVFFDLYLNKQLSKQSWGWWFETPSRPLWRNSNVTA